MSKYPEDDRMLAELALGKDAIWRKLYDDLRSPFRLYFLGKGCTPEEAIDIYQEAMVILHRKVIRKQLQPPMESTIKTYIIGVGRILLMRRGNKKSVLEDDFPEVGIEAEVDNKHDQLAQAKLVKHLLNQLEDPCKKIIELFYLRNYVMEAIAEELELPSAGAARRRKHDCLKKLRALIN